MRLDSQVYRKEIIRPAPSAAESSFCAQSERATRLARSFTAANATLPAAIHGMSQMGDVLSFLTNSDFFVQLVK
jgi:hypothetical protein